MMDLHIHTAMYNCMTFHNHRVAQFEIMPHLQQMYALFHAQNCFDMGFTTLRDLGMNGPRGLLVDEMCAVRDSINALKQPTAGKFLTGQFGAQGESVGELVVNMTSKGLSFAKAQPGQEFAYLALQRAFVNFAATAGVPDTGFRVMVRK